MSAADDSVQHRLLSDEADLVFKALADHTRRRILVRLSQSPDDAGAVARDLGLSRQAVAKQLRILESGGIVSSTTRSSRRVHSVSPSQIREVSDLLGIVAHGWDRRLRGIKAQAERAGEDP
ncbi:MAG: ArsR/SmtB family transcription factor [Brevibacterium linens]